MSLGTFLATLSGRDLRTSTGRPRVKAKHVLRPGLEDLEGRLVLSHASVAMAHIQAVHQQVAARPQQPIPLPLTLTNLNITSVTRDANGLISAVGTATGTLAGHTFTTPLTLTAPAQPAGSVPVLDLHLDAIHLNLLGLKVDTSPICLNISAQTGAGNLLGNLVGDLANLLNPTTPTTPTGTTTPTLPTAADVNNLLGNSSLLNSLNANLSQLTSNLASASSIQSATRNILTLQAGPVNLNLLGLNVHADNCSNGPITVAISAQPGQGRLLGNLLADIANLLNRQGNANGRLAKDLRSVVSRVTSARTV